MDKFISIKEASLLIGVTTTTLRRWEKLGTFLPNHRTLGNHRRYKLNKVLNLIKKEDTQTQKKIICYSRVSTHEQKQDLDRQSKVLEQYANNNKFKNIEFINDIGSGMNYKKKGLNKLIKLILDNKVDKLIITHKDRLQTY